MFLCYRVRFDDLETPDPVDSKNKDLKRGKGKDLALSLKFYNKGAEINLRQYIEHHRKLLK
jgi:hypothetical protein